MVKKRTVTIDGIELSLDGKTGEFFVSLCEFGYFTETGAGCYKTASFEERRSSHQKPRNFEFRLIHAISEFTNRVQKSKISDSSLFLTHLALMLLLSETHGRNRVDCISPLGRFQVSEAKRNDEFCQRQSSEVTGRQPVGARPTPLIETNERSEVLNSDSYDLTALRGCVKHKRKSCVTVDSCNSRFDDVMLTIAGDWLAWNQSQQPWIDRRKNSRKPVSRESYARDIAALMADTGLNYDGVKEVFQFCKTDSFWRKLSCSPSYLLSTSTNGRKKIDSILLKIRENYTKNNPFEIIDNGDWENPFNV